MLGHGVFISLLALAWKHALLRSTYGDSAFQIFNWIAKPGWDIEAHRYTAILPQAAVKLFALFPVNLHTLLLVASLAHALVPYSVFALCAYMLKAPRAALGCVIAAVLCTRLTFYDPVLESNYLLTFPFLLFGFIERRALDERWSAWHIVVAFALLLVPLIVHPIGWTVMLFGMVFLFVEGMLPRRPAFMLGACTLAWPLIARWIFPPTGYELSQYALMGEGFHQLRSFGAWGSVDFLVQHSFFASNTYLPALLSLLFVVISLWAMKRKVSASLTFLGAIAFIAMYLITFHAGDAAALMDRGILPLATIIALPFASLVITTEEGLEATWPVKWTVPILTILTIVILTKLRDVSFASRPYQHRYDGMLTLMHRMDEQGITKAIVSPEQLQENNVDAGWALSSEALLISAVRGADSTRYILSEDMTKWVHTIHNGDLVIGDWVYHITQKDEQWFRPPIGPYVRLR